MGGNSIQAIEARKALLVFLENYIRENGWAPTYTEITDATGLPRTTAHGYLRQLEKEGKVKLGKRGPQSGARMIALVAEETKQTRQRRGR